MERAVGKSALHAKMATPATTSMASARTAILDGLEIGELWQGAVAET